MTLFFNSASAKSLFRAYLQLILTIFFNSASAKSFFRAYLELILTLFFNSASAKSFFRTYLQLILDLIFQLRVHLAASGWFAPRHRATFVACHLAWQPSEAKKMAITACEVRRNCVLTSLATTDVALISCARFRKIDFIRSACSKKLCNTAVAKQPLFRVYLFFHHLGPRK